MPMVTRAELRASIARLVRTSDFRLHCRTRIRPTGFTRGGLSAALSSFATSSKRRIPVLAFIGVQLGWLLVGTVITETVFSRQGIGRLIVSAIQTKDFPVVQGVVLFTALMYVVLNLIVDLSYPLLDPRLRHH